MKSNSLKISLILSILFTTACGVAVTAFAAPLRWLGSAGLKNNNAAVDPWIKVTISSADGFDSDEEYVATFTVKQWAENGNYKLVLSGIDFLCPPETESLDPDKMWEYYADGVWAPISEARSLELIPIITFNTNTAYLKLRIKPGFLQTPDFMKYLECSLKLTAELALL